MTVDDILTAMKLPDESHVDQRIPKKLLLENAARTAADRRQINEGIDELLWIAALKPASTGVAAFHDETRDIPELSVLTLQLRPAARSGRVIELIHRAIPYPLLLITAQDDRVELSLALKRMAQNEAGKMVLEGGITSVLVPEEPMRSEFLASLSLERQPRTSLLSVYEGWMACLEAVQAAGITGQFGVSADQAARTVRREALVEAERLRDEIQRLRQQAVREKQWQRRVELNLELKRLDAALEEVRQRL